MPRLIAGMAEKTVGKRLGGGHIIACLWSAAYRSVQDAAHHSSRVPDCDHGLVVRFHLSRNFRPRPEQLLRLLDCSKRHCGEERAVAGIEFDVHSSLVCSSDWHRSSDRWFLFHAWSKTVALPCRTASAKAPSADSNLSDTLH